MSFRLRAPRALIVLLALVGTVAVSSAATAAHVKRAPLAAPERLLVPVNYSPETPSATPTPDAEPAPTVTTIAVARGDTLMDLLVGAGSPPRDAARAIRAFSTRFNPRKLRVGQELTVVLDPAAASGTGRRLAAVSLSLDRGAYLVVRRRGNGFVVLRASAPFAPSAGKTPAAATSRVILRVARGDTLMELLMRAGAAPHEAHEAAGALGRLYDPRRLRVGQELSVVLDPAGPDRAPKLAAASLALGRDRFVVVRRVAADRYRAYRARAPFTPAAETPTAAPAPLSVAPAAKDRAAMETSDSAAPEADSSEGRQVAPATADNVVFKTLRLRKGDTLMSVLLRAGCARRDARAAVAALGRRFDLRRLQIDQELTIVFDRGGGSAHRLAAVSLALDRDSYLVAGRDADGLFTSKPAHAPLLAALFDGDTAATPPEPEIAFAPEPEAALSKRLRVEKGDTLMDALVGAGSERREAYDAIVALSRLYNPRRLKAGQQLTVVFEEGADGGAGVLYSVALALEPGRSVEARRTETGDFAAREVEVPLERVLVHAGGRIRSSLYQATAQAGIPLPVMMEMIRAFSFDVDFQRDIQRGDTFSVLFERYLDDTGAAVREGRVLFASLTLSSSRLDIYRYRMADGRSDYFDASGQSVRKALLRTPVNGARLSSGYGKRRHPILGYTRMHRGIDFAAPRGTPIVSAGDGVVVRAGWYSSYGRYVRIRHRGTYSTAYAHMTRIAKGIRKGKRVKQGQVIGYVGSTGRSTGPHLHYEVLRNGRQINPLKIKLPTGVKLKGAELAAFERARRDIERRLAALPLVHNLADTGAPACGGDTALNARDAARSAAC
ncbi:MAG: peptidoglycan DD-metalloendopeptidase family protein [Alphaproteobacteria bacterium]